MKSKVVSRIIIITTFLNIFSCKLKKMDLDSSVFYVKDYIETNDKNLTKPIQRILDKMTHAENRTIIFPKGNYFISNVFLIGEKEKIYSHLSLIGNDTKLKQLKNSKPNVFLLENIQNLKIKDISIDGNKSQQKHQRGTGFKIRQCNYVEVSSVSVENCSQSGIKLNTINNLLIENSNFSNNGVNNKEIYSDGIAAANVLEGIIKNNTCNYNNSKKLMDGDGIQVGISEDFREKDNIKILIIEGNTCIGNGRRGIKVQRSKVQVLNNKIFGNKAKQIAIVQNYSIFDIYIQGNIIGNDLTKSMQSLVIHGGKKHSGIHRRINISNNTFSGTYTNQGILLDDCENVTFEQNKMKFNPGEESIPDILITERCKESSVIHEGKRRIKNSGTNILINNY